MAIFLSKLTPVLSDFCLSFLSFLRDPRGKIENCKGKFVCLLNLKLLILFTHRPLSRFGLRRLNFDFLAAKW